MPRTAIDFSDTDLTALSLRNLRSVAAIANEGSVSAAARRLGFSQAALSSQLAAAEAALSVTLFERHGRGVVPTDAGRSTVQRIRDVFAAFEALRADAGGTHRPTLSIGATESTVSRVLPFVQRAERKHTDLRFELRIGTSTEIRRLVESGELEIAVAATQQGNSRAVTCEPLYEQDLVLLVPAAHALASRRSAALAQLHGEKLLLGEDTCLYRRVVERGIEDAHVDVVMRARLGALGTLPAAVAAGFGVAILPRELADPPPAGTASVRLRHAISVPIDMIVRRTASQSARRVAADLRTSFS